MVTWNVWSCERLRLNIFNLWAHFVCMHSIRKNSQITHTQKTEYFHSTHYKSTTDEDQTVKIVKGVSHWRDKVIHLQYINLHDAHDKINTVRSSKHRMNWQEFWPPLCRQSTHVHSQTVSNVKAHACNSLSCLLDKMGSGDALFFSLMQWKSYAQHATGSPGDW